MALIKLGPVVADARGSVGGTVFSRNAAGAYMKQRTVPTYPGSAAQVARAALMTTIVDDWKTSMSDAARDDWNDLANQTTLTNKLGEQFRPSAFNLFVRANTLLDLCGLTHVTIPPISATAPTPIFVMQHTIDVGLHVTAIGNWDNTPLGRTLLSWGMHIPQSIYYFKGPFTLLGSMDFDVYDALPLILRANADLQVTKRYFVRARAVHEDGSVSAAAIYSVDTPASLVT